MLPILWSSYQSSSKLGGKLRLNEQKKTSLTDSLKSLEGHVVESVEIKGEHILVCEGNEGDILHVRISASELDPKYSEHIRLASKVLSFSILEADFLSRILDYIVDRVQGNLQSLQDARKSYSEIFANLKEKKISITEDLIFSLKDVRKLLQQIKGTITETLHIRKRIEVPEEET